MGLRSPYVVTLDAADRQTLEHLARCGRAEHRQVLRARIVLAAADGEPNAAIARRLGVHQDTVRKWRKRFGQQGMAGLADRPRSARPRVFPAAVVAEVKGEAQNQQITGKPAIEIWRCLTR